MTSRRLFPAARWRCAPLRPSPGFAVDPAAAGRATAAATIRPPTRGKASDRPAFLREIQVFLRVDLAIAAGGVGVAEGHALLDHVLEEMDQVRLLEQRGFAVRPVPEFAPPAVVVLPKKSGAPRAELGHTDEFAGGLLVRDSPLHALYASVGGDHLLGVVRRMLGARAIVL